MSDSSDDDSLSNWRIVHHDSDAESPLAEAEEPPPLTKPVAEPEMRYPLPAAPPPLTKAVKRLRVLVRNKAMYGHVVTEQSMRKAGMTRSDVNAVRSDNGIGPADFDARPEEYTARATVVDGFLGLVRADDGILPVGEWLKRQGKYNHHAHDVLSIERRGKTSLMKTHNVSRFEELERGETVSVRCKRYKLA